MSFIGVYCEIYIIEIIIRTTIIQGSTINAFDYQIKINLEYFQNCIIKYEDGI